MKQNRLLELAGVQLNESNIKNIIDSYAHKNDLMIEELLKLEASLKKENHTASAASISNIIGAMQRNASLFLSARQDLEKQYKRPQEK